MHHARHHGCHCLFVAAGGGQGFSPISFHHFLPAVQTLETPSADAKGQIFTPVMLNHLLRIFNYGHDRFDYQYHFPLLKILLASFTVGIIRLKMVLFPFPNPFFLSMAKFFRDLRKYGYKLFLDVKLW